MMTSKISMNWKNALKLAVLLSLFWCLIVFLGYTGVVSARVEAGIALKDMFIETGRLFIVNFAMFFGLFSFQFSVFNKKCKTKRKALILTTGSILIVFAFVAFITFLFDFLNIRKIEMPNVFFLLAYAIIISAMTNLLAFLVYIIGEREKTIIENEKLLIENMRARYETLKSQLNPHFLFNSLNTLVGLIGKDAARAKEFVHQLSYVFRYSIQNRETVTLDDELLFTEAFCNLMKIRYNTSLIIESRIDKQYRSYFVIPLSLQMLVENAIKHNTISPRNPLTISIETTNNNTVRVWNAIQPRIEDTSGEGIGLANMAERYRMLYNKGITISDTEGIFSVEIPLIVVSR